MIEERRLRKEVEIPQGVQASVEGRVIKLKGKLGEVSRKVADPTIEMKIEGNKVILIPKKFSKRQKCLINTTRAHIRKMIKGVQEPFIYKLKVCSGHFPMSVAVEGNSKFTVKNFFGEKVPRHAKILPGVKVEVKGDIVTVSGPDLESVGQTAANIEASTRITNRDRRVFQDGVWIFEKEGKRVGA